jgi:hypothetical protein
MEEDVRFLDDRVGGWAEKNGLIDAVRYFPLLLKANTRALYDKGPLEGRPNCQNLPFKMEGREGSIEGGTEGRRDGGTEGRRDGGTEGRRGGGTASVLQRIPPYTEEMLNPSVFPPFLAIFDPFPPFFVNFWPFVGHF